MTVLQHLTILNLHENKIKELPHGIGELVNLTTLDISHNHLESLPEGQLHVWWGCGLVVWLSSSVFF